MLYERIMKLPTIDCLDSKGVYQDPKPIRDLIDLEQFIAKNQANEYLFYFPNYTAKFTVCQRVIDLACEFAVGCGEKGRSYEVKTFQTLIYLLSENVGVDDIPLFFQIGNYLFDVEVKGLTPPW